MKTVGLIGGLSWQSTAEYYRIINEEVQQRLGGVHSARCLIYSFDFAEIEALQSANRWSEAAERLSHAAAALELAGADYLLICSNTMHIVWDEVSRAVHIPVIHIADATGRRILETGIRSVGLLGTRFTMEGRFYTERLERFFHLQVLVPEPADRELVHDVIYKELVQGIIKEQSRAQVLAVIRRLEAQGAQGIILGCTELGLLIRTDDTTTAVFDTTRLHAIAAVDEMLTRA